MKVTAPAGDLADALAWVAAAVSPRPAEPVLAGILVEAIDGELRVSGFDYDIAMRAVVPNATVGEPGVALIPGRVLASVAGKMRGDVSLTSLDDHPGVVLQAGRAKYTLDLLPLDRYPKLDGQFVHQPTATVDGQFLQLTLSKVLHAASREPTVLTAIHMDADDGKLWFSTTDRYRIARYFLPYKGAFGDALPVAKTIHDVAKGLHGQVSMAAESGVLTLADATHQASMRCLAGEFPKVQSLVENTRPVWSARFRRLDLLEALTRLASVHEAAGAVPPPAVLTIHQDGMDVTSTSQSSASSGVEFVDSTGKSIDGRAVAWPVEQRIDPRYLIDVLKAHVADDIEIGSSNPDKPVPLRIAGDAAMQSLLMPQRKTN